jgi:hypothetical protein
MVWQEGLVEFTTFFTLLIPSVVNFVVPAALMHFAIPKGTPSASNERVVMRRGAKRIMILFGCTIGTAVSFHNFLHLPPFLCMMTGLAYLQFFGYYLKKTHVPISKEKSYVGAIGDVAPIGQEDHMFDVYHRLARAEWDTLLFFYSVVLCVGGLGFIGYLALVSETMYIDMGPTIANIAVGVLSAIVDNIPVMFAVLTMTGYASWPLVAGDPDSRCRRQHTLYRLRGRCCADGPGPWSVHLFRASEMGTGYPARQCRKHCRTYVDQRGYLQYTDRGRLTPPAVVIPFLPAVATLRRHHNSGQSHPAVHRGLPVHQPLR